MTNGTRDRAVVDGTARSRGLIASAGLALVAMTVVLWWATHYASLVEWLGEWQFAKIGYYFPSLTTALTVAIVALPVAGIVAWARHRRRKRAIRDGLLSPLDEVTVALNGALRGRIFFLVIAGFAALWALAAGLTILGQPSSRGALATVRGDEAAVMPDGPARFAPGRMLGRVGRLEERVGLASRVTYVAPVRPIGARTGPVRFFTEVERLAGPEPRFVPIRQGILKTNGLPGELVNLYRENVVAVVDRPALLVRDEDWLSWRPIVLAVQLALLALVALIAALLLRRQARRLDRFRDGAIRA